VAPTAHALNEDRQIGFEAGYNDLSKPLNKKTLLGLRETHALNTASFAFNKLIAASRMRHKTIEIPTKKFH